MFGYLYQILVFILAGSALVVALRQKYTAQAVYASRDGFVYTKTETLEAIKEIVRGEVRRCWREDFLVTVPPKSSTYSNRSYPLKEVIHFLVKESTVRWSPEVPAVADHLTIDSDTDTKPDLSS